MEFLANISDAPFEEVEDQAPVSPLFQLPTELQDMIFDLAYPDTEYGYLSKEAWEAYEDAHEREILRRGGMLEKD
jgi:hypothetical protein